MDSAIFTCMCHSLNLLCTFSLADVVTAVYGHAKLRALRCNVETSELIIDIIVIIACLIFVDDSINDNLKI